MRKLAALGFSVTKGSATFDVALRPLVLVENERTAGGRHDDWKDVTGERYHFPNQYRNKMRTGSPFVYYRGVRRRDGRRVTAEYFGAGVIGEVYRDDEVPDDSSRSRWKWFCDIEEYEPFATPVQAKQGAQHLEQISPNQWGVAVRELPRNTHAEILRLAGSEAALATQNIQAVSRENLPPTVVDASSLIITSSGFGSRGRAGGRQRRRSRRAKEIGDKAEQLVFDHLASTLKSIEVHTLEWVAREGLTPGWDIQYVRADGQRIAVEVKGTTRPRFPNIEVTAGEWLAAEKEGASYELYLVAKVLDAPTIAKVRDPFRLATAGQIESTPSSWRLTWITR